MDLLVGLLALSVLAVVIVLASSISYGREDITHESMYVCMYPLRMDC